MSTGPVSVITSGWRSAGSPTKSTSHCSCGQTAQTARKRSGPSSASEMRVAKPVTRMGRSGFAAVGSDTARAWNRRARPGGGEGLARHEHRPGQRVVPEEAPSLRAEPPAEAGEGDRGTAEESPAGHHADRSLRRVLPRGHLTPLGLTLSPAALVWTMRRRRRSRPRERASAGRRRQPAADGRRGGHARAKRQMSWASLLDQDSSAAPPDRSTGVDCC